MNFLLLNFLEDIQVLFAGQLVPLFFEQVKVPQVSKWEGSNWKVDSLIREGGGVCVTRSPRFTSGATPADLLAYIEHLPGSIVLSVNVEPQAPY